ncbi:MAG: ParA family protein [Candidatus Heimdallarchaeota archaeon]
MKGFKTIAFISAPGGVGKTTIALCLAWFLAERNKSTLLLDLDPSLGLTLTLKDFRDYYQEIEYKRCTSADLLEKALEGGPSQDFEFKHFLTRAPFQGVTLEFIASSIRLEDVMGKIWHTPTAGHSEKKLKEALGYIPGNFNYEYLLIDNIPCYGLTYALTTIHASDAYIVPLRLTINDLGRTLQMIKKLQETAAKFDLSEEQFVNKLYFLYNMVETQYRRESKIPTYEKQIRNMFPGANFFEAFVPSQVGFTRIGTEEERPGDSKKVRELFKPFYTDFERKIMGQYW